jgi:hypothetical protein
MLSVGLSCLLSSTVAADYLLSLLVGTLGLAAQKPRCTLNRMFPLRITPA